MTTSLTIIQIAQRSTYEWRNSYSVQCFMFAAQSEASSSTFSVKCLCKLNRRLSSCTNPEVFLHEGCICVCTRCNRHSEWCYYFRGFSFNTPVNKVLRGEVSGCSDAVLMRSQQTHMARAHPAHATHASRVRNQNNNQSTKVRTQLLIGWLMDRGTPGCDDVIQVGDIPGPYVSHF